MPASLKTETFTPGQWAATEGRTGAFEVWAAESDPKISVIKTQRRICSVERERDEHAANARLIAAAPDLLAALRDIATLARMSDRVTALAGIGALADGALAKAEGR